MIKKILLQVGEMKYTRNYYKWVDSHELKSATPIQLNNNNSNMNSKFDDKFTDEEEKILKDYHMDKLHNTFNKIYNSIDTDDKEHKIAYSIAATIRIANFPVTVDEIAYDFNNVTKSDISDKLKTIKDEFDINRDIHNTSLEEYQMLYVNNIHTTSDFKKFLLFLRDEVVKSEQHLKTQANNYDNATLMGTMIWITSKVVPLSAENINKKQITNIIPTSVTEINDCYLDLFRDNGYGFNVTLSDNKGLMQHLVNKQNKLNLTKDDLDYLSVFSEQYEKYEYDNKSIAELMLVEIYDYDYDDCTINSAQLKRIHDKIK